MTKLNIPFDKCYCLHLADNTNRYENIINECKRLGIEDKLDIWWTTKRDISNKIGDSLTELHTDFYDNYRENNKHIYGNVFNCSFEHYTIIKQAYERDLNSILILEDDFEFIDDIDLIQKYFDNLPEDYSIIRFYTNNIPDPIYETKHMYIKNAWGYYQGTLCYALSRTGMKAVIDEYNKNFKAADIILDSLSDISYYSNIRLLKQVKLGTNILY